MTDATLWNSDQAAEAMGVSRRTFMDSIRFMPGFPKPLPRPPGQHSGRQYWSAKAIEKYLEKASQGEAA